MLTPAPGQLRNVLPQIGHNLGGLAAVFFVPHEHVVLVPDSLDDVVPGSALLRAGATWYQLAATLETVRYVETPAGDRHAPTWKAQLKGILPKDSPALAGGLAAMRGRRFLVLYRDANGQMKLVGDIGSPLTFTYGLDTGAQRRERNERAFTFAAELPRPARTYTGGWLVSNLGLQYEQPGGAGGTGGVVLVRDPAGNVLTTLTVGQTLVLNTAFSFTYSVQ